MEIGKMKRTLRCCSTGAKSVGMTSQSSNKYTYIEIYITLHIYIVIDVGICVIVYMHKYIFIMHIFLSSIIS